jgi:hypothetical protein
VIIKPGVRIERATPLLSIILAIFGVLEMISGVIFFFLLLPQTYPYAHEYDVVSYTPALASLYIGIISGLVVFAVAAGVAYLAQIRDSVESIRVGVDLEGR